MAAGDNSFPKIDKIIEVKDGTCHIEIDILHSLTQLNQLEKLEAGKTA